MAVPSWRLATATGVDARADDGVGVEARSTMGAIALARTLDAPPTPRCEYYEDL